MVRRFFYFLAPLSEICATKFSTDVQDFLQLSCVQWIHVRRKHAFRVTAHLVRCISRRLHVCTWCRWQVLTLFSVCNYVIRSKYLGQQQVTSAAPRAALPPIGPPVSQPARRARLMVLAGHGANADTPVVYRTHRQHEDHQIIIYLYSGTSILYMQQQSSEHDCADRPVAERHRGRGRGQGATSKHKKHSLKKQRQNGGDDAAGGGLGEEVFLSRKVRLTNLLFV